MAPVDVLRLEFCRRKSRNQRYSVRSYARDLRISPGALSQILAGKRPLTVKKAKAIADVLPLPPKERELLISDPKKGEAGIQGTNGGVLEISEDAYHFVSEWYHYAILSLTKTSSFRNDPGWIARRLGITPIEASTAIQRLLRMRLLTETDAKNLAEGDSQHLDPDLVPESAHKRYHQQRLEHALNCLDTVEEEHQAIASISLAINLKKLPAAKGIIDEFRQELTELLEDKETSEVYNLNIQLVPVTSPQDRPTMPTAH